MNAGLLDLTQIKGAAYQYRWYEAGPPHANGAVCLVLSGTSARVMVELRGPGIQLRFNDEKITAVLWRRGWLDDGGCLRSIKETEYLRAFFKTAAIAANGSDNPSNDIPVCAYEDKDTAEIREAVIALTGSYEDLRTEALREIMTRVGQEIFRKKLDERWHERCAVTGVGTRETLRASHIKPWADASPEERLDPYNGLLLVANLDALFDKGFLSFDKDGKMMISPQLNKKEHAKLGLSSEMRLSQTNPEQEKYLTYHRRNIYLN